MKYLVLLLKSPFFVLKWSLILPLAAAIMVIDRISPGGWDGFLSRCVYAPIEY
jgi:hypothetical protein